MGEIIKFDFVNKKRISDEVENPEPIKTEGFDRKQFMENADLFMKFIEFITSDKGKKLLNLPTTSLALSQSQEIVSKYSNEELLGWLEGHDESEWQVKPSFFRSVFEELKERLEMFRPIYEDFKKNHMSDLDDDI